MDHAGENVVAGFIGTEPVFSAGSAVRSKGIARFTIAPLIASHGTVRVLVDERPDSPTLRIFSFQIAGINAPKTVFLENWVFPIGVVVAHAGEIDVPFILADDRFGPRDHWRKNGDQGKEANKIEGKHRESAAPVSLPGFSPETG